MTVTSQVHFQPFFIAADPIWKNVWVARENLRRKIRRLPGNIPWNDGEVSLASIMVMMMMIIIHIVIMRLVLIETWDDDDDGSSYSSREHFNYKEDKFFSWWRWWWWFFSLTYLQKFTIFCFAKNIQFLGIPTSTSASTSTSTISYCWTSSSIFELSWTVFPIYCKLHRLC